MVENEKRRGSDPIVVQGCTPFEEMLAPADFDVTLAEVSAAAKLGLAVEAAEPLQEGRTRREGEQENEAISEEKKSIVGGGG